jgi:general secretion pathway protein G
MKTATPQPNSSGNLAGCHSATRQPGSFLQAGYQLVEVMVVVAIVAIIGLIAVPSYSRYIDRTNKATTESDIAIIVQSIDQYFLENRGYPNSLDDIGHGSKLDPWDNTYSYLRISGANLKGKALLRKDGALNPVNSDYDLYSAGKDGQTKLPFSPKVSHDDIVRASNGRFIGYAADF